MFFIGASGKRYLYTEIAELVRGTKLRKKHIINQLRGLGLIEEFYGGTSPYSLPFSFSDYEEVRSGKTRED